MEAVSSIRAPGVAVVEPATNDTDEVVAREIPTGIWIPPTTIRNASVSRLHLLEDFGTATN